MTENSRHARHVPVRTCVICRRRFARAQLQRYTLDGDGKLNPDEKMITPGRGWYCCNDPACARKFASFVPRGRRAIRKNEKSAMR